MQATCAENPAMLDLLVELKANVNETTPTGWSALMSACFHCSYLPAKRLLELKASPHVIQKNQESDPSSCLSFLITR
jgi:ankyrin repeat protein